MEVESIDKRYSYSDAYGLMELYDMLNRHNQFQFEAIQEAKGFDLSDIIKTTRTLTTDSRSFDVISLMGVEIGLEFIEGFVKSSIKLDLNIPYKGIEFRGVEHYRREDDYVMHQGNKMTKYEVLRTANTEIN